MSRVLPILFNTEMVQAILDNQKTVTRRIIKPQPWKIGEGEHECRHEKGFFDMGGNKWACRQCGCGVIPMKGGSYFHAPYQPGDVLYVRETWNFAYEMDDSDQIIEDTGHYVYCADDPMPFSHWVDANTGEHKDYMPWRPSIHMPKAAARIWLRVTGVRTERIQETTNPIKYPAGKDNTILREGFKRTCDFIDCWNSTINKADLGKYGWDANPWVWVIEFEIGEKPEVGDA